MYFMMVLLVCRCKCNRLRGKPVAIQVSAIRFRFFPFLAFAIRKLHRPGNYNICKQGMVWQTLPVYVLVPHSVHRFGLKYRIAV